MPKHRITDDDASEEANGNKRRRLRDEEEDDGDGEDVDGHEGESEHDDEDDSAEDENKNDNGNDKAVTTTPRASRKRNSTGAPTSTSAAQDSSSSPSNKTPSKINTAGKPAEAGIVTKISVENFMCHRKLAIDLCHNVNFIHGQNGSGKSAILAALQICLGAGAKRTNRARNLKELVRKEGNANYAKVRVTLLNKGPDAFQHDVYGDYITIERSISLGGSYNGFRLYGEDKAVKSTLRRDLNNLLDQLNIQVENPVAVLDQEEAKKFLMGKAEDKYNFFTKATDLERLDRTYAATVDHIIEMTNQNDKIKDSIRPLSENVKQLAKEWEQFKQLEKLEDKLDEMRVKLAWSYYTVYKNELDEEEGKLARYDEAVEKRKAAYEKALANSDNSEDGKAEINALLTTLANEADDARNRRAQLQSELKEAMKPKKQQERLIKAHQVEMNSAKKSLASAMRALDSKRKEIMQRAGSAESDAAKRTARMKKAEDRIAEAKETIERNKPQIEDNLKQYEQSQPRESALVESADNIGRQCHAVQSKINALKQSEGNSLNMFGPKCVAMNQKVEQAKRAGRFRGRVVGPIGKHLKVNPGKEQFASMAELALQVQVDRWIVTNDHDRGVYMQLRREINCNTRDCGVFQMTEASRYNVTQPPPGVETVGTVLNATDDLVYNCLVDNGRTDQKALMESKESSENILLESNNNGGHRIKGGNIKTVYFLPDGDFWNVYGGSLSLTSQDKKLKQTIGVDRTVAIQESERELEQLNRERRQLQTDLDRAKKERHEFKVAWNRLKRTNDAEVNRIQKLEQEIEKIREENEEAENVVDDTSEFEEDVKNAQFGYDNLKGKEDELRKELEDLMPGIATLQRNLEEESARNVKVMKDLKDAEDRLSAFMSEEKERDRILERKREKAEKAQEARATQQLQVENKQKMADDILHKAKVSTLRTMKAQESKRRALENAENGEPEELEEEKDETEELNTIEPIRATKGPNYYEQRIARDEAKIRDERERRRLTESDPEVALEKFQRAKKDLDQKLYQIDKIDANISSMTDDLKERKKKWKHFRSFISEMTDDNFNNILNRKDSAGEIKFNHKEKTLDLIVQKDGKDKKTKTHDVKALSGGERSYTTLALLLALGECLETPFRVMDEFDVFLDPVARRIALQTMIEVAKTFEHRQFIFITPQDLSNIKTDPKLKIFQLKPPKRSELVGGPEQQILPFSE